MKIIAICILIIATVAVTSAIDCKDNEWDCKGKCILTGRPCDGNCQSGRWLCKSNGQDTCKPDEEKVNWYSCNGECTPIGDQCDGHCSDFTQDGVGYYPCNNQCQQQSQKCNGKCDTDWCVDGAKCTQDESVCSGAVVAKTGGGIVFVVLAIASSLLILN